MTDYAGDVEGGLLWNCLAANVGVAECSWDRASATLRLFPGTLLIENEYHIFRRRKR